MIGKGDQEADQHEGTNEKGLSLQPYGWAERMIRQPKHPLKPLFHHDSQNASALQQRIDWRPQHSECAGHNAADGPHPGEAIGLTCQPY